MTVPFVGLTGGLGAGKSTALAVLAQLGAATLSTDVVVHHLYETEGVRHAVRERWGAEVFDGDRIDRQAVARRAFAGEDGEREWLEALLWPLVDERVRVFRRELQERTPSPPAGVVETPLLFEAGAEAGYDATIAVVASDELRAERLRARDQQELARRERRQLTQTEKASRATFSVVNDGTLEELEVKLAAVLDALGR